MPDQLFLDTICEYLEPRRLVTTEVFLRGPVYKDLWLSVGIEVVPGQSIAMLLALWLVVTPLVQNVESLSSLQDWLLITGLDRVLPSEVREGAPAYTMSLAGGIAVIVAWTVVPLLAGAWRTLTREA